MKTYIYSTAVETARALIKHLISLMEEEPQKIFHIAFSGGSTPSLMFDLWAEEFKDATPWSRMRIYWVDERCVPAEDSESNYGNMRCCWMKWEYLRSIFFLLTAATIPMMRRIAILA